MKVAAVVVRCGLMARATPFGVRLRTLREAAGLSQEELAERAGVKRGAVARWELGTRDPSWNSVQALAKALGVDLNAFADPADEPKLPQENE